jgi:hypothetical protein
MGFAPPLIAHEVGSKTTMAKGLKVGDSVYVPRARLGSGSDGPSALVRLTVQALEGRSIVVNPNGSSSVTVASSAAHKDIGVMILRIGDFESETALLDPLAKSLLQYCRLLLPDDMIIQREVRSTDERCDLPTSFKHFGRPTLLFTAISFWLDTARTTL